MPGGYPWLSSKESLCKFLLREAIIVIRTHDEPNKPHIALLLHTILGPDYYVTAAFLRFTVLLKLVGFSGKGWSSRFEKIFGNVDWVLPACLPTVSTPQQLPPQHDGGVYLYAPFWANEMVLIYDHSQYRWEKSCVLSNYVLTLLSPDTHQSRRLVSLHIQCII